PTTSAALAALGMRTTSSSEIRYVMRSSITAPDSSQHKVYWALPAATLRMSLVRQVLTNSAAPGPETRALPRWLTSKSPTAVRVAVCSATVPVYWSGMDQPPNGANVAPASTWRECSGPSRSSPVSVM